MTIGAWGLFWVLALAIIAVGLVIGFAITDDARGLISLFATIPICLCILFGMHWWYGNTESGKRAIKTQESNFDGGIRRHVSVYDAVGNLIQEWDGKFDVDFDADGKRILFDDENGRRHLVYFKTGTVIVEEVDEKEDKRG